MRTIQYNSNRQITDKATLQTLAGGLDDLERADNAITVAAVSMHYADVEQDGSTVRAAIPSVTLEMETAMADEATDRDTLAQEVVNLGYEPDTSTAKDQIELA